MTQLGQAIARYHKLLESAPYKDLEWAAALIEQMNQEHLTIAGRPLTPFLRPHLISQRQYQSMVKAAEALFAAIDRIIAMALENPALLARMQLLPAEKMLASIEPGYRSLAVNSLLDTQLTNGSIRFVGYNSDAPSGVAYGEVLSNLFYSCPPVKEFRRRYKLNKLGGTKPLLKSMLKVYKEFGGKGAPKIAILEVPQPYQPTGQGEYLLLREVFRRHGYLTEIVSPDQLEFRGGVLRKGNFAIDLVYRRVKVRDFLMRFDLSQPLVRAYRAHAVCMVNSFRSELAHKRALFDLLTDGEVTSKFPSAEKKAIRDYIPWTRVVSSRKTTHEGRTIDLLRFILKNREKLVLKPNDDSSDQQSFRGWETDGPVWERAIRTALRNPYVVQERVVPATAVFPLLRYDQLELREMRVDLHPHAFLGKVDGCSGWLSTPGSEMFSTLNGLVPTFILEKKSK